eukprot:568286-Prymnesium_polylepis.1
MDPLASPHADAREGGGAVVAEEAAKKSVSVLSISMSALIVGRESGWMIIVLIVEYLSGSLSRISAIMTSSLSWSRV